jgi:hypothetical protein
MNQYDRSPEEAKAIFNDDVVPKDMRARAYYLINEKITDRIKRAEARSWVSGKLRRESDIRKFIERLESL